ncbi:putative membrane protein [Streptomyces sp. TLI_146]|nr:putative membrane protein [Streptomyces sp. TLI_146]
MHGALLALPENRVHSAPISEQTLPKRHVGVPARLDPYLLAAALFAAYAAVSVLRYRRMETLSWDLGIFEQAVRAYAHLRTPVADLKGPGTNILGDHFSPVTALLAPFYRLFPTPVTLLVAQAALFALSAVPVARGAARLLGRGAGLAVGVAYGLSWGLQRAVDFDFHEICFAVPLIAFALEAVLARHWRAALCWALPLVVVKEDLGLTLAAIAVVVALRARRSSPRTAAYALGAAAFGIAAVVVTLTAVIPAFNSTGAYDYWGKTTGAGPFTASGTKLRTLLWLLLPTGLLAVRSPLFLAAMPTLGWRFLSSDDHYWSTDWHYSAVLMPVLALALADAVDTGRRSPRPWLRSYARQLPAAAAAAALALTTSLPLYSLTEAAAYRRSPEVAERERMLASVPDGASVEADVGPVSRLTSRCRVFWVGDTRGVVPEYIALDNISGWAGNPLEYARELHPGSRYAMAGVAYGYVLLKRQT